MGIRTLIILLALLLPGMANASGTLEAVVADVPELAMPFGLDFLPNGSLVVADYKKHNIVVVNRNGSASILAGASKSGYRDGKGAEALFNGPHNLIVNPQGKVIVADTFNSRIRVVDPVDGTTTTLAGAEKGFAGDGGPLSSARFSDTFHVAFMNSQLMLVDLGNRRVRRLTDTVATVAGNGKRGVPADGSIATEAPLVDPRACCADANGNLYILERGGHALRVVDTQGKIRTVVGTGKAGGLSEGLGAQCTLNGAKFVWPEKDGNILIADTVNHAIRRYHAANGRVTTIAGTGKQGKGKAGGSALATALNNPHGVSADANGVIFISDTENGRILRLKP
ncbi:MAG: hypothetical protein ACOYNP_10295 [Gemmataceae bacterium]